MLWTWLFPPGCWLKPGFAAALCPCNPPGASMQWGGRLHWGEREFGGGWGLGCRKVGLVKGGWMVISALHENAPLLAVVGRWGRCPRGEQGVAGSHAGWDTGTISALVQAVVPTGWLREDDSTVGLSPGKAYEITYVRLKFHTSRPESFAIYKRSRAEGPWVPFQYYSASCEKTYGKRPRHYLRPGEDEQVAFCTDEFSDISPLSGGNVAFSTLEGRPSAYNFDGSPTLQVPPGWEGGGSVVPQDQVNQCGHLGLKALVVSCTPVGKGVGCIPVRVGSGCPRHLGQGAFPVSPAGMGDRHRPAHLLEPPQHIWGRHLQGPQGAAVVLLRHL